MQNLNKKFNDLNKKKKMENKFDTHRKKIYSFLRIILSIDD